MKERGVVDDFQASAAGVCMNDDTCHPHGACGGNKSGKGKMMDEF